MAAAEPPAPPPGAAYLPPLTASALRLSGSGAVGMAARHNASRGTSPPVVESQAAPASPPVPTGVRALLDQRRRSAHALDFPTAEPASAIGADGELDEVDYGRRVVLPSRNTPVAAPVVRTAPPPPSGKPTLGSMMGRMFPNKK